MSLLFVTVDSAGLWAPILLSILYYLAAAVVFPHDEADPRGRCASLAVTD